ncbi:helix-turn-helix transcriptional regulator [Pseudidiomarina sp.]|uniref:helix-turn-helix transcriptional regulator n=1 Tax=Pseudidiomarina sp. TaxID=2081707 RepID=UPI003A978F01
MAKAQIISRIERIAQLLRSKPMSAEEIKDALREEFGIEASKRTILRDLNDSKGKYGIRLHRKARQREPALWTIGGRKPGSAPEFTDEVALAALIAQKQLVGIKHQQLINKLNPLFEYASAVLEHNTDNHSLAANWHRFVEYAPSDHQLNAPDIDVRLFEDLLSHVFKRNMVKIDYMKHQGDTPEVRRGKALGIVYRGRVPYFVMQYVQTDPNRHPFIAFLPVSRIRAISGVITADVEVHDFNLTEAVEKHFSMTIGEPFTLELQIFDSVRREVQDAHLGKDQVIRPIPGKSTLHWLTVEVPYNQNLVNWLLARSPYLKVLGPEPFKRMFYRDLRRAADYEHAEYVEVPPRSEKTFVSFEDEEKRNPS